MLLQWQEIRELGLSRFATLTDAKARAEQTFERSMRIGAGKGKPTNY